MDTTIYVALSAQVALQKQLETVANNVANAGTAGFKADRPFFQAYLDRLAGPGGGVSFVEDAATYIDRASGPMEITNNPLDIAVEGDGFLSVAGTDGTRYTRDGHMSVSSDGTLTDSVRVAASSAPTALPSNSRRRSRPCEIKNNGNIKATVNSRQQDIGRSACSRPNNPNLMRKGGDGMLTAPQGEMRPSHPDEGVARIVQGIDRGFDRPADEGNRQHDRTEPRL